MTTNRIAPSWSYFNHNWGGTPPAANPSVSFTPGVSGAKGSTTSLFTVTVDCEYLWVNLGPSNLSALAPNLLVDIMYDPAGGTSWSVLVPDLQGGGRQQIGLTSGPAGSYHIPIFIPAGSSLGVRGASPGGTAPSTNGITVCAYGGNKNPTTWWCGQTVTAYGPTSVTPGASSAWGSWTSVGSTLSSDVSALLLGVGINNTAVTAQGYEIQFGAGSTRIGYGTCISTSTAEVIASQGEMPVFASFPAGTQMQARARSSGASPQALFVSIYGIS